LPEPNIDRIIQQRSDHSRNCSGVAFSGLGGSALSGRVSGGRNVW
jgi:hypothetical protein